MSKLNSSIYTAVAGAVFLMGSDGRGPQVQAEEVEMENCFVKKGDIGFIEKHKADCKSADGEGCAGTNEAGDATAWIYVPKGQCAKINLNKFDGISAEIKAKVDVKALEKALEEALEEALKKEALKKEALKKEALKKEALKKEALKKEALKKEALKKEALETDLEK